MEEHEKEKIKRFLSDTLMANTVRKVILDAFLKPQKEKDVHYLASSRIAIDLLSEAWKELNKFKNKEDDTKEVSKQVGL